MYQLTHNGQPVGKPHPHKMAAYIEAVERKLVTVSRGLYQFVDGVEIVELVPMLVPVIEPLDLRRRNVYEHPPLDPYKGEYPRYLREPGASRPRTEITWVEQEQSE